MADTAQPRPPLDAEDATSLREFIDLVRHLDETIDLNEASNLPDSAELLAVAGYWFEIVLEKAPGDRSLPELLREFRQLTDDDIARYLKG